jgi:hypothetical protein
LPGIDGGLQEAAAFGGEAAAAERGAEEVEQIPPAGVQLPACQFSVNQLATMGGVLD